MMPHSIKPMKSVKKPTLAQNASQTGVMSNTDTTSSLTITSQMPELSPCGLYTVDLVHRNVVIVNDEWWADNDSFNKAAISLQNHCKWWGGQGYRIIPQAQFVEDTLPF